MANETLIVGVVHNKVVVLVRLLVAFLKAAFHVSGDSEVEYLSWLDLVNRLCVELQLALVFERLFAGDAVIDGIFRSLVILIVPSWCLFRSAGGFLLVFVSDMIAHKLVISGNKGARMTLHAVQTNRQILKANSPIRIFIEVAFRLGARLLEVVGPQVSIESPD